MAKRTTVGLKIIGVLKLASAVLLAAAGFGIFHLLRLGIDYDMEHFMAQLHLAPHKHLIHAMLARLTGVDQKYLKEIGVGTFFYATLYLIEGIGLLKGRHWAEYLTIIVTCSFLPLEGYEIVQKMSVIPVFVFAANLAIVIYLIQQLKHDRQQH